MTQSPHTNDAIIDELLGWYGNHYERLSITDKHYLTCTFSWAITDMMDGASPDESWDAALDEYSDKIPDAFCFDEISGRQLARMIYSQFEALTGELRRSRRAVMDQLQDG